MTAKKFCQAFFLSHRGGNRLFILLIVALVFSIPIKAQTTIVTDSATIKGTTVVIPGIEFKRSGYHNFFWGKHYRPEWTTPVRVKNFYLDTAKGGLIPSEEGGSRQSKTIRLKNPKGKEYVLRSINKDFGRGFDKIYQGTFITRVAKDQASFGYPYAAFTIRPMISVTGILHTNPELVFVPVQPALGDYNKKYGNELYLFEERPDDNQEDAEYFGNSKNLIGSPNLIQKIYEDNDNHVDQKAFVKARLFDMFVGDWSRHADQWRWAKFEDGKLNIYKPVPRDRDQAYSIFDGLWPWVATNLVGGTHLETFSRKIKSVKNFNKPGRPLDRPFTNELEEEDWLNAAKELQEVLTDAVISYGVHQVPSQVFDISGETIIAKLKSRRDRLQENASDYYHVLARHVDLIGSDEREYFEITRLDDRQTKINIFKITNENEIKQKPFYSRTFNASETKEVRIYSLNKPDIIKVSGDHHGVKIRIIDPKATDSLLIENKRNVRTSIGNKFFFDTLHEKKFDFSIKPLQTDPEYDLFEREMLPLFTKIGIPLSANFLFIPKPWRKKEYQHQHVLFVNYGPFKQAFNFGYVGRMRKVIGNLDVLIKGRVDMPATQNFFGVGNETTEEVTTATYYRTYSTRYYGGLGLAHENDYHSADLNFFYQNINLQNKEGHFFTETTLIDPALFNNRQFAGVSAGYHFRKVNDRLFATKGFAFQLGGGYMQNMDLTSRSFTNIAGSVSGYLPLGKSFSVATRVGAATLSGDADYYHLNKLGGNVNLRGYERDRFFGKTSFYNNNEIRWITDTRNYFFNGRIGLLVFHDEGRVWQPLEDSDKWHTGYGAGLIVIPFNKITLVTTYCISEETKILQLRAGLSF